MILFLKLDNGTFINVANIESIERNEDSGIEVHMVSGIYYHIRNISPVEFINRCYEKSNKEIDWGYL